MKKNALVGIFFAFLLNTCIFSPFTMVSAQTVRPSITIKPSISPTGINPAVEPTTGIHLTLSPVFINITTNPGTPVSSEFKVTNNNNVKEYFQIGLIGFRADQTGGNIRPVEVDNSDEFVKWITFSENQFELEANETKVIRFKISPPRDAALGYYYGIRVGRIREKKAEAQEAIVSGSATLPLLMEVRSPNSKKEMSILDFSTDSPFYEYLPIKFNIKIKNSGNIHLVPFGDIFIDQGGRKEIAVVQANAGRSNILPQTERMLTSEWSEGFPLRVAKKIGETVVTNEKGKTVYTTQWDFTKAANFRIGKYTANLIMVYNNGSADVPLNATVSFWVIPWKILLGLLAVVLLVLIGLKSIVSSVFRKR